MNGDARPVGLALARPEAKRGVVALFSATMLTSAILLFSVQPMVARFVLPTFGSAPQVWAVALVFFQAVLLLGYLYAHLSSSRLGVHRALTLHAVLLVAPVLTLPLGVPAASADTAAGNPAWVLLGLLTVSVGLPFFVVSSTAPLLQRWLVHTDHPAGKDPYFLYRASNFGSVLGLVSYPLLFEPRLTLDEQGRLWTWGYAALVVLLAGCIAYVWRSSTAPKPVVTGPDERLTVRRRLTWLMLAAVPSGLIVAATTTLTTDVAPIPLLWVLPLGLYLITFMIAFSSGGGSRRVYELSVWLMPAAILAVIVVTVAEIRTPLWLIIAVAPARRVRRGDGLPRPARPGPAGAAAPDDLLPRGVGRRRARRRVRGAGRPGRVQRAVGVPAGAAAGRAAVARRAPGATRRRARSATSRGRSRSRSRCTSRSRSSTRSTSC